MLRIFRHYIPTSLVLLGAAETLILLVSIYVGVSISLALPNGGPIGSQSQLWAQAAIFCVAMLLGMVAMGFYQRDQRDGPLSTMIRLVLSFCVGFAMMGFIYVIFPQLVVEGPAFPSRWQARSSASQRVACCASRTRMRISPNAS